MTVLRHGASVSLDADQNWTPRILVLPVGLWQLTVVKRQRSGEGQSDRRRARRATARLSGELQQSDLQTAFAWPIGGMRFAPLANGHAEGAMTISGGWLSRRANSDDNWANAAFIAISFAAITAVLFVASRRGLASQANELIAAGICLAAMISVIRLSNAVCFMKLTCREQEAIFPLAVLLIVASAGVLRLTCGFILTLLIISSLCSFRYQIRKSVLPGIIFGAVLV
jgi:hypothetical protein